MGRVQTKAGWGRTPLAISQSSDDGATWSQPLVLEEEEGHGYCYTAMFFTEDQSLLLAYCSGGEADGACLARLSIRKVKL